MSSFNNQLLPKVSYRYDTLDSTNAAALASIGSDHPPAHGDVFLADAQTAGRGQGTNHWHSSPGANLTLSLVIHPDHLTADRLFSLSQMTALAIAETVKFFVGAELADSVSVKWPNDVYVGNKKIAGILVQNGLRGSKVSWSVAGIGLNVGERNFPAKLETLATSLLLLTGQRHQNDVVRTKLFAYLTRLYNFTDSHFQPEQYNLNDAYHEHLYRKDVVSPFLLTATGQEFEGIIRGVDQFGRLRVEQKVGRESLFSVGEIKLISEVA